MSEYVFIKMLVVFFWVMFDFMVNCYGRLRLIIIILLLDLII